MFPAAFRFRMHKKGPPGVMHRAAQAGGILESFLDYHSTFGARNTSETDGDEVFVKLHGFIYTKVQICVILYKREEPASLPHERSDLDEVYLHLQKSLSE